MIIGLTGRNAAGKGAACSFLESKGFHCLSLSDVIRDELQKRGMEPSRENMIEVGNELRGRFGRDVLARRILEKVEGDRNYVIDSIRHPDEVAALRTRPDFTLVVVESAPEHRFERLRERGRVGDPQNFEDFQAFEDRESGNEGSPKQQLEATADCADRTISNNAGLTEFHERLATMAAELSGRVERPGWDEYFMRLAKVASQRSNCIKRKVAAIIVRDRRVISTGYNGTPRGTKNCYEGGCPRCNNLADSGTRLDECLCSHGEENAIVQAAYHGVSVKGSTIYTTFAPCLMCTKMIINAGIQEVVYNEDYPLNDTSFRLLEEAGVAARRHRVSG